MNASQMTFTSHGRALLGLGMPLVGSNLAHIATGVIDTIMVGRYSSEALAGLVLAGSFYYLLLLVGSGFAWGVLPMVATHSERSEIDELRRVTRMGLWASVAFGLAVLPLLLSNRVIFSALGQKPEIIPIAADYLSVASWGIFPALALILMRSYFSALERTQVVLWVAIGMTALNAGLNWVLIFGNLGFPEMGVKGAAVASVITLVIAQFAMMAYARYVEPTHQLFARIWRIDPAALGRVFRLGWPISLTMLAETSLFSGAAIMVGWVGTIQLAAHGIALQIASITFMVHMGLSNAATVRVGRALGRQDIPHLRRGATVATFASLFVSAATIALFVSVPSLLAVPFISADDPQRDQIIAFARVLILIAAVFQTADGLQVIGLGLLRGLQDTRQPMIIATISYWLIGMPTAYALGFPMNFGAAGVWMGLVVGLLAAAVFLMIRFWRIAPRISA